jgi:hypothetical protein
MNPKSLDKKEMPFTLQVDSTCLHCHTSGAAMSLPVVAITLRMRLPQGVASHVSRAMAGRFFAG